MKWEVKGAKKKKRQIGVQGSEKTATPPHHFYKAA
jgi:hypothetical protein